MLAERDAALEQAQEALRKARGETNKGAASLSSKLLTAEADLDSAESTALKLRSQLASCEGLLEQEAHARHAAAQQVAALQDELHSLSLGSQQQPGNQQHMQRLRKDLSQKDEEMNELRGKVRRLKQTQLELEDAHHRSATFRIVMRCFLMEIA